MAKIVISENVSLDGVGQDPTGREGFEHGGWFERSIDNDREAWVKLEYDEALCATALLMGRRSYEYFAVRWRSRTGEWADRLRSMPKYVVSSTLVDPDWGNASVLRGDVADEVATLKQELDGEIVVNASFQLGRTLMEHDLVDEVRLIVFPVVLGAGERVFGEAGDERPMRLVDTRTVGDGLAFLAYAVDRTAPRAEARSRPSRLNRATPGYAGNACWEQTRRSCDAAQRPAAQVLAKQARPRR